MQADEIKASISYMRQELLYRDKQIATALEKGLPALIVGAKAYMQELQRTLGGMLQTQVLHSWLPLHLDVLMMLAICVRPSFRCI